MPTPTANYSFQLPTPGGDDDVWGDLLNANWTSLDTLLRQAMPLGGIIMWSGAVNAVPAGWALCDGQNGTPDLRDRFVVGAGGNYAVNDTGGANDVTLTTGQLPAHNHGVNLTTGGQSNDHSHFFNANTNTVGNHQHQILHHAGVSHFGGGPNQNWGRIGDTFINTNQLPSYLTSAAGAHSHNVQGNTGGTSSNHTHNVSGNTANTGSGEAHENRPPYYALAYIMKV